MSSALSEVIISSTCLNKNEIVEIERIIVKRFQHFVNIVQKSGTCLQNDSIRECLNGVTSSVNERNNHPSIKTVKDKMEQLDSPNICSDFVSYNENSPN